MARKEAAGAQRATSTRSPNDRTNAQPPSKAFPWRGIGATLALIAVCVVIRGAIGSSAQAGDASVAAADNASHKAPESPRAVGPNHDVMAIVNGQDISRTALAQACVERHGEDVLEGIVNKRLIEHHCRNRGVAVTDDELNAEIERMAKRFKLASDQWLELLKNQRGVSAAEYKRDILWPTLALRKLAAGDLKATDDELSKAYATRYGAAVQARLLVVSDEAKATQVQREAAARPDEFARLAMQHSEDVNSASIGGMIQPIRQHTGEPALERVAFALKPGEVSQVVKVGPQFALLKCEGRIPPRNVPLAEVRAELEESLVEDKLRGVANDLFAKLQSSATVQNVYNNPDLRQAMPGVVATINGDQITMQELGDECLARHGDEVLEVEVSHLLLRQELDRTKQAVAQQDLEAEMGHAAVLAGMVNERGEPDLPKWVKAATQEQEVSYEMYVRDSVWPSAALKKLTQQSVEVSADDLQKGFEANYGERVRCRAIVLGDLRRAQEVWDKARQNPTVAFFGELAEQYSIEPSSRSLRGEVPPVRQHGGQPQLERAAFALAEGELSGITQVGDKYIILRCEGRTEPINVRPEEVQEVLSQDLFEKKLRLAMSDEFARIRSDARIDNYLAGTSQAPAKATAKRGPQQASRENGRTDTAVQPATATR
ncbi:MAG: peptidylprolyl isomerase [Lacipirellulaceae bacterium]